MARRLNGLIYRNIYCLSKRPRLKWLERATRMRKRLFAAWPSTIGRVSFARTKNRVLQITLSSCQRKRFPGLEHAYGGLFDLVGTCGGGPHVPNDLGSSLDRVAYRSFDPA